MIIMQSFIQLLDVTVHALYPFCIENAVVSFQGWGGGYPQIVIYLKSGNINWLITEYYLYCKTLIMIANYFQLNMIFIKISYNFEYFLQLKGNFYLFPPPPLTHTISCQVQR